MIQKREWLKTRKKPKDKAHKIPTCLTTENWTLTHENGDILISQGKGKLAKCREIYVHMSWETDEFFV